MARCLAPFVLLLALAAPASARESLGMFADWGAFRDPAVPRCYAIAKARPSSARRDYRPYASVGSWPRRAVRGQVHIRLSRELAEQPRIRLALGDKRFELTGGGGDGWAKNRAMDAAIVAAMRSAGSMSVSATDTRGQRFTDRYSLEGVATALDAATIGCARVAR
jgi:hypothetical protein